MFTFKNAQDRILRMLDEAGDTTTTLALTKDMINASHKRVIGSQRWPWLMWPREEGFTTATGIRIYALHPATSSLSHLWDVEQRVFVPIYPRRQWETTGVDRSSDSHNGFGVSLGPLWPVAYQPTDTTLSLVSTDVGDVSAFYLEGTNSSNDSISETLTCTGTTPVVSSNVWRTLSRVTVTGLPTGTRTLTSGSTTLLSLKVAELGKLYPTVEFLEYPAVGRQYTYQFRQGVPFLERDNDIPFIHPNDCAEILVYDSLLDFATYNTELGEEHMRLWKGRYDAIWKQLVDANEDAMIGSVPRTVRDLDGVNRRMFVTG